MPDNPLAELVPRSELLRVAEVIRTEERRKRFCLQVALGVAVVMVLLLILGMGVLALQAVSARLSEIDYHRLYAAQALQQQRNQEALTALLDQCETALRAADVERADWALKEAERRLAEGGAEQLKDRVSRCRADLGMLRELDRIDNLRWARGGEMNIAPMPREVKR